MMVKYNREQVQATDPIKSRFWIQILRQMTKSPIKSMKEALITVWDQHRISVRQVVSIEMVREHSGGGSIYGS